MDKTKGQLIALGVIIWSVLPLPMRNAIVT